MQCCVVLLEAVWVSRATQRWAESDSQLPGEKKTPLPVTMEGTQGR